MVQLGLLGSEFFSNILLPFALIFTVVFAMLDKTELLGKRKDINAIIALIFGLIAVGVPAAIGVVQNLIPVIAVVLVILLVWLLVFGFVGKEIEAKWSEGLKKLFSIVIGVILLGIVAWAAGLFAYISPNPELVAKVIQTALLVGVIIAVIAVVVGGGEKKEEEK